MALLDPSIRSYRPSRRDFLRLGGLGAAAADESGLLRFDAETLRPFAALPDLPHMPVGCLDMAAEPGGVEEWLRSGIFH